MGAAAHRAAALPQCYELDGMTVAVMARATLIDLKRRRGSGLDLADIEAIELLEQLDD